MDRIVTPDQAARLLHGDGAGKSQAGVIRRQCADGVIRNCEKHGTRWYINATREWPHLVGEAEPPQPPQAETPQKQAVITADMTVKEMLGAIAALA